MTTAPFARRQLLLVASQCQKMPELSFLPPKTFQPLDGRADGGITAERRLVLDLYDQLTHPSVGGCRPVDGLGAIDGLSLLRDGLVVNPTHAQADEALIHAIRAAADQSAVLLVYYVGHGQQYEEPGQTIRHLLQVLDTERFPSDTGRSSKGWDPYCTILNERKHVGSLLGGLILMVDSCFASSAAQVVGQWFSASAELRTAWIGSSVLGQAFDGCFTKSLVELLRRGVPKEIHETHSLVTRLTLNDVAPLIAKACPKQRPAVGGYQNYDQTMYIATNRAADATLSGLGLDVREREMVAQLTERYVAHDLDRIAVTSQRARLTVVLGGPGSGKSTLAAALRRPPDDFNQAAADAVVFLSLTQSASDVARVVSDQLATIPRFRQALDRYRRAQSADWAQLSAADRLLLGPLAMYGDHVMIVVDGFDQLDDVNRAGVGELLMRLTTADGLSRVRVVVTSRDTTDVPPHAARVDLAPLDDLTVAKFLALESPSLAGQAPTLFDQAGGNWLVLKTLIAASEGGGPTEWVTCDVRTSSERLYARFLEAAAQRLDWDKTLRPVLSVLSAVAGNGPVLPFALLADAVHALGGPAQRDTIYEALADVDLYRLIVRAAPGGEEEHVGAFHATLSVWLASGSAAVESKAPVSAAEGHAALFGAIERLAPQSDRRPRDAVDRYAAAAEAEHAWQGGRRDAIVGVLDGRRRPLPKENLAIWRAWLPRIADAFAADDPIALTARARFARWIGEAGDPAAASALLTSLVADQERIAPLDRETLRTRSNLILARGQMTFNEEGGRKNTLRAFADLLADQEKTLPPDDRDVLTTRFNVAHWLGHCGDAAGAVDTLDQLLKTQTRLLPVDDRDAFRTRAFIARWTAKRNGRGDSDAARHAWESLLVDQERALGQLDPDTLRTRFEIAEAIRAGGDATTALRLFEELAVDQDRVLGPDDPATLRTGAAIERLKA